MADDATDRRGPAGALKRPRFEAGDYLGARDLAAEQDWRRQRMRRHNRHAHGWGIVCGLWVAPALEPSRPWSVIVCPGYALGPYGDEILTYRAVRVDLREWVWSRPSGAVRVAFVAIRYAELAGAPRLYRAGDCSCEERKTLPSMTGEGWRIDILWSMPDTRTPAPVDICHELPECVPCPPSPHLLLAAITLPEEEGTTIMRPDIDLSVRRII
jgi:hypothetical protein